MVIFSSEDSCRNFVKFAGWTSAKSAQVSSCQVFNKCVNALRRKVASGFFVTRAAMKVILSVFEVPLGLVGVTDAELSSGAGADMLVEQKVSSKDC